jgi:hypothetical protein
MSKHYAFLKNNRVEQVLIFDSKNDELATRIKEENNFDSFVWLNEENLQIWSTYDGRVFTPPTDEYLLSIGILQPVIETINPITPTE